jgi:hypothetical protein
MAAYYVDISDSTNGRGFFWIARWLTGSEEEVPWSGLVSE